MRKRDRGAWTALFVITGQIAKAKPTTAAGALALVGYVGHRSWPEYQNLFAEEGNLHNVPAHFAQVLRAARQRSERSITA